jgi:TIR domain-containing protein
VPDFFISYNRQDRIWAEWIAWTLEKAGFTTILQAWDFRPGACDAVPREAGPSRRSRIHPAPLVARAFMPVRAAGLSHGPPWQGPVIGKNQPLTTISQRQAPATRSR